MESFGNFAYGYAVVFEQCHGLVSDFIANDRVRSFANHLFDDTGEVLDRDAQGIGVKFDVMFFGKMFRDQFHEVECDEIAPAEVRGGCRFFPVDKGA